jgi:hypothetical protein
MSAGGCGKESAMDEALPYVLGTAAIVLVRPLRRRVVPVARTVVAATIGVGAAVAAGAGAVVSAAVRGDPPRQPQAT